MALFIAGCSTERGADNAKTVHPTIRIAKANMAANADKKIRVSSACLGEALRSRVFICGWKSCQSCPFISVTVERSGAFVEAFSSVQPSACRSWPPTRPTTSFAVPDRLWSPQSSNTQCADGKESRFRGRVGALRRPGIAARCPCQNPSNACGSGERHGKHPETAVLLAFLQIGGLANIVSEVGNLFSKLRNFVGKLVDEVLLLSDAMRL